MDRQQPGRVLRDMITVLLLLFLCLYWIGLPFFFDAAFESIASSKTVFYRWIALYLRTPGGLKIPSLLAWTSLLALVYAVSRRLGTAPQKAGTAAQTAGDGTGHRWKPDALDCCILVYEAAVILSYLASSYKKEAQLGFYGWNMGLYAQLSMGALYFLCSRFLDRKNRGRVLLIICASAAVIYATGIPQRFRIDVYGFYEMIEGEIPWRYSRIMGPIGHVDYVGSYMMLTLSLGMCAWLFGETGRVRLAGLIFLVPGFLFVPVMGADSLWPAFLVVLMFLMVVSFTDRAYFRRWLQMLLLCVLMFMVIALLRQFLPDRYVSVLKPMSTKLLHWQVLIVPLLLLAAAVPAYDRLIPGTSDGERRLVRLRKLALGLVGAAAALFLLYFVLNSMKLLPESISRRDGPVFFNEKWGTRRGGTWMISWDGWKDSVRRHPIRFLVGSGPDTYYSAVYLPKEAEFEALHGKDVIFPTGMNEFLTMLCNLGVLGLASFISIPLILLYRMYRDDRRGMERCAYPAAVLGYYVFGFLNFHGVTSTPGMFILTGMAQAWFLEKEREVVQSGSHAPGEAVSAERPALKKTDPGAGEPLISVILPTYNREETLMEAVQSVLGQSWRNLELLLVDDGSTDKTKALAESVRDPRLKYIYREHLGVSAARNYGVRTARGAYIAFQDSDDIWYPEKLARQMAVMRETGADVVICRLARYENGQIVRRYPRFIAEGPVTAQDDLIGIGTQAMLADARIFDRELFDEEMPRYVEMEWLLRILKDHRVYCMDEVLVSYRVGSDSISSNVDKQLTALDHFLKKHGKDKKKQPALYMHLIRNLFQGFRQDPERGKRSGQYLHLAAALYPGMLRFLSAGRKMVPKC